MSKRTPFDIKEADVERALVRRIEALGGRAEKFTSPARRSVPDRLILLPVPPEHRALVARYVRFAECKRPGAKPTESQEKDHERRRAMGFRVDVVDSVEGENNE